MHISLSPQRRDDALVVSKQGEILTINAEQFDFGPLADGGTIPANAIPCDWIVGPVERIAGVVRLTLLLPHGPSPSPGVAFPEAITVTSDGPIELPHDPAPAPEPEPADVDA
jgi:hypothetical protein